MSDLHQFLDKQVEVEISGNHVYTGRLVDLGLDLMVLLHEDRYMYIPLVHVKKVKASTRMKDMNSNSVSADRPIDYQTDPLSFRKILSHAKGLFVEIYISGDKTIHGYLTSIMNDYFLFYSPVYKAMFVSMNHLKWLCPYRPDLTPYSLDHQSLPVNPVNISLSRTFEEQFKRLEGKLVVLDLGDNPFKIGLLQKADQQIIRIINAKGEHILWNLHHLKTVHMT